MNREQILSNKSKMMDRSKMADENQIFKHNSNSFSIYFLLSFDVSWTQILWKKKLFKKFKLAAGIGKTYFSSHLEFLETFLDR
jgi:hypothetical protein